MVISQDVPTGYYSIVEVFNYLGRDIFTFQWTDEEIEIGKDQLLRQKLPHFEEWVFEQASELSKGSYAKDDYKDYVGFDSEKWDLWYSLKKHFSDTLIRGTSYLFEDEKQMSLEDFVSPKTPFKDLDAFLQCTMRYLVTKRRVLRMLDGAPLKGYIKDNETGQIVSISYECWLGNERTDSRKFSMDLFRGMGIYKFHNGPKFEIFRGPVIISKKSFDIFREGKRPEMESDYPLLTEELCRADEERKKEKKMQKEAKALKREETRQKQEVEALALAEAPRKAEEEKEVIQEPDLTPKGSAYMIKLAECYDHFKLDENPMPPDRDIEKWIKEHAPFVKTDRKILYFIAFLREPQGRKKKNKKAKKSETLLLSPNS